MSRLASAISYSFLLSPMLLLVTALAGACAACRWRRAGLAVALVSLVCLDALATPALADRLLGALERHRPAPAAPGPPPGVIVVLGADVAPGDRLGRTSLERLFIAAREFRAAPLPVLVSGGILEPARIALADMMAQALEEDFGIAVRWREDQSQTTWENAAFSARILRQHGVSSIILVVQAADMARAAWSFERAGIHVVPARLGPAPAPADEFRDFLPSASALMESFVAEHELLGLLYYRVIH